MPSAVESLHLAAFATDDLSAALRESIIRLCVAAHGIPDFENLFSYIPAGGRHFLALHDGELVGHAVVTTRWLQPEHEPVLKTAYVDAVATSPTAQGRGYGSALMRALADGIDDYAIACLETERVGFYARLGWELWRGPLAGRNERGLVPTPDQQGIMILRLARTPPLDLDRGLSIECQDARIW
jgi:aminoglycoside 2'-N-acetyltransferase I